MKTIVRRLRRLEDRLTPAANAYELSIVEEIRERRRRREEREGRPYVPTPSSALALNYRPRTLAEALRAGRFGTRQDRRGES